MDALLAAGRVGFYTSIEMRLVGRRLVLPCAVVAGLAVWPAAATAIEEAGATEGASAFEPGVRAPGSAMPLLRGSIGGFGLLPGALAPIRPVATEPETPAEPAAQGPRLALWAASADPAKNPGPALRDQPQNRGNVERAKRDPLSALSERDKKILGEAAERLVERTLPWLDMKLLRRLEILQTLRLDRMEFRWNVTQKPGVTLATYRESGKFPVILNGRTSVQMIPGHWNVSWFVDAPMDARPVMQVKTQVWVRKRFHADVGYAFSTNTRLTDVVRTGAAATVGWKIGIYALDYSFRGHAGEHAFALSTLF